MNVAVTAASGQLGRFILEALVEEIGAANVVGIARAPEKIGVGNIETRQADYLSEADFGTALRGIDTALIVASPMGPDDRVQMHRNVINGAKRAGVRKLLYTSVVGNGWEEDTLFGPVQAVNRQAEDDLKNSGLEWVIGRNGLYLEIDVDHIVAAADDGVFRNSGSDGRCRYITRPELAYAWAKLATDDAHIGNVYNLVGEGKTQQELIDIVNKEYANTVTYEPMTDQEFLAKVEPERGELVAKMITGCYQCIRVGAYDVDSDYEKATGRPAKSVAEMVREIHLGKA